MDAAIQDLESRLLELIRGGAGGTKSLEEVMGGIAQIIGEMRPHFSRLLEVQERRDLAYANVAQLEALRKHSLWLYRRCLIEQVFFAKLRLERGLRDRLYRQVIESWHEMGLLDEQERELQGKSEDTLAKELLSAASDELGHDAT